MNVLLLVFALQEMKLSQLRPLHLRNLSQRGMWGGRKVMLLIPKHKLIVSTIDMARLLQCFLLTAVGDTVSEDEVVCEIETDKVKLHKC